MASLWCLYLYIYFKAFKKKMEVMFTEIWEEFIAICKKIDRRIQLWEQDNREFNKKMYYNFLNYIKSIKMTLMNEKIQS